MRATGTFSVKAFVPTELVPDPAVTTGLPVGVTHSFRHRLLTKNGVTEWSDPFVTIVVK